MNILGINFSLSRAIGKTKTRSQILLMKTADGRLVYREFPVLSAAAVDEELCSGYLLYGDNQYQDEITRQWVQIVDEKSTVPICLLSPIDLKEKENDPKDGKSKMFKLLRGIFHDSWTRDLVTLNRQQAEEKRANLLYLALVIAVSVGAIAIALKAF